MAFTAQDVKALREKTGCGMMDCKKALTEANGDMDTAIDVLRKQGLAKQAKKADRIAAEGIALAITNETNTKGVVIEVNAETDFVAKNADFQAFVNTCAQTVMAENPADVEALLATKAVGSEMTVAELLQEKVLTIGENIQIRRFELVDGACVAYVHAGGKIGVIVNFDTDIDAASPEFVAYGKDIAMQIAALNTPYLNEAEVPAEVIEHEKSIMVEQMKNDPKMANKPQQVLEKIVSGKLGKYYKENCLVDQEFVKDNTLTVGKYTDATAKKLGGSIAIKKFIRFEKGEGIEKRQDDFAAEVASMVK
ncbi:translation elongation factor Ts [uncultured Ruminococcus sp.]|uniref:translation elongation factor Ts n=1 Tax=uncultured Ruminococcus sp. TaxID=165186 RepID=UPI0029312CCF|nr:translation elongation factor Ts [uncultured Ruminococcus sp.]